MASPGCFRDLAVRGPGQAGAGPCPAVGLLPGGFLPPHLPEPLGLASPPLLAASVTRSELSVSALRPPTLAGLVPSTQHCCGHQEGPVTGAPGGPQGFCPGCYCSFKKQKKTKKGKCCQLC